MHVALAHARARDAYEAWSAAQLRNITAAGIAHRRAQTARQLMQDSDHAALIGDAPLNALGNELFKLGGCVLKISVGGAEAFGHRTERAHAAIGFVGCSLIKLDLARGLLGAGKKAANHDRVGARSDRLGDVAG